MFQAVQCAERAVKLDVTWAVARQTLGRAQLGMGEVKMVRILLVTELKCFGCLVTSLCRLSCAGIAQFPKGSPFGSTKQRGIQKSMFVQLNLLPQLYLWQELYLIAL